MHFAKKSLSCFSERQGKDCGVVLLIGDTRMTTQATTEEQSIPAQQPDYKELQDIIKQTK